MFHKVIYYNKLVAYVQYLKQSLIETEGSRKVRHTFIKRASNTIKTSKSLFYRGTKLYSSLPLSIKSLEPENFNSRIKQLVRTQYSPDKVP